MSPLPKPKSQPRFPSVELFSQGEFQGYFRDAKPTIDANYLYERSLASVDTWVQMPGVCAPCLRPTLFSSATEGGEIVGGGRRMPNWREQMLCDCADQLGARYRATLHFLQSVVGFTQRTSLLSFGRQTPLDEALRRRIRDMDRIERLSSAIEGYTLDLPAASRQIVVSMDALHLVPPLDAALAETRRVLMADGAFVFTVPFYIFAAATTSRLDGLVRRGKMLPVESAHPVHDIGWDILDRLRNAGFRSASVHLYRSEELGYLGLFNVLISAFA